MKVNRFIIIVLDSVGIGELPDAVEFGDVGANTLGNIARAVKGINLPNLQAMGLANIAAIEGLVPQLTPTAVYGKMAEISAGKDTTTGHWELMGVHLKRPFPLYPNGFPTELMAQFEAAIGRGTLGNYPASGTVILDELGAEHMATGKPIIYTSGDSVFQIAAHEEIIPIEELYDICQKARDILRGEHEVSRVIARPFVGKAGSFIRTVNRHDYSVNPPLPTLMDNLKDAGMMVHVVGKIQDIFAAQGTTSHVYTQDNMDGIDQTLAAILEKSRQGIIFTNLVDFDAQFGHRNNPEGYAEALEAFDQRLPELLAALKDDDILVITADHGNDPTYPGTDHTREYVPILLSGKPVRAGANIGVRSSFADLAATIADTFGVKRPFVGQSFKTKIIDSPDTASHAALVTLLENDPAQIAGIIDHTLLRPDATEENVEKLCKEAVENQFASVCINPTHVRFAARQLEGSGVKVCTVIGFPLGATTTSDKIEETRRAITGGAAEIDMVINIGALKEKENAFVERQIASIVHEAHQGGALCKVIIETALLTDEEKERVCRYAMRAGADFVKTSTGFSQWGATVDDIALMRRVVGPKMGVKASGGIRSFADAITMVQAGATRIGASSGVAIVNQARGNRDGNDSEGQLSY
jgi:phosphopentomutase